MKSTRLLWYDLLTPQAASLAVSFVSIVGAVLFWMTRGLPVRAVLLRFTHDFYSLNIVLDASNLVLLGLSVWILARVTDLPAAFRKITGKTVLLALVAALAIAALSTGVEVLSDHFLHTTLSRTSDQLSVLPKNSGQLTLGIFSVALLGPLAEEAYFRGILMGWLARHLGVARAVLISSLIFGVLHLRFLSPGGADGWIITAELMAVGAALALIAVRSGSLWASFIAHAANNLGAVLLSVYWHG